MNKWKAILLVGGIFAYPYIKTALSLVRMDFGFGGVNVKQVDEDSITLGLILSVNNSTQTHVRFQAINAEIVLNNRVVGHINDNYDFYINPRTKEYFEIILDISKENAGSQLWHLIKTRNTDIHLQIKGTAKANGKIYPLTINYTTDSIIEMINKK